MLVHWGKKKLKKRMIKTLTDFHIFWCDCKKLPHLHNSRFHSARVVTLGSICSLKEKLSGPFTRRGCDTKGHVAPMCISFPLIRLSLWEARKSTSCPDRNDRLVKANKPDALRMSSLAVERSEVQKERKCSAENVWSDCMSHFYTPIPIFSSPDLRALRNTTVLIQTSISISLQSNISHLL